MVCRNSGWATLGAEEALAFTAGLTFPTGTSDETATTEAEIMKHHDAARKYFNALDVENTRKRILSDYTEMLAGRMI